MWLGCRSPLASKANGEECREVQSKNIWKAAFCPCQFQSNQEIGPAVPLGEMRLLPEAADAEGSSGSSTFIFLELIIES